MKVASLTLFIGGLALLDTLQTYGASDSSHRYRTDKDYAMLEQQQQRFLFSADIHPRWEAMDRLASLGLDKYMIPVDGNVHALVEVVRRHDLQCPALDFVFIDGDHREWAVMRDLRAILPYIRKGGLVVMHDWFWANVSSSPAKRALINVWDELQIGSSVHDMAGVVIDTGYQGFCVLRKINT